MALVTNERMGTGSEVANGFGVRYSNIADAVLGLGHHLLAVSIGRRRSDLAGPATVLAADKGEYLAIDWTGGGHPVKAAGRTVRTAVFGRSRLGPARAWERRLVAELSIWQPDVVLVASPFRPSLSLLVRRSLPLAWFAEEDLRPSVTQESHRKLALQRWAARLRRPEAVVVMSEAEAAWARRALPRAPVFVIPHGIDVSYWAARPGEPDDTGPPVFAIGAFGQRRNYDGLVAVAKAMDDRGLDPRVGIRVVTASTMPDAVVGSSSRMQVLGRVEDPRPYYSAARVALVPAFKVSGVKTQILQAWAAGRPVVTTVEAAASVGGIDGGDLLAGSTPEEVVDRLERVLADPELAASLVANGRRTVAERFSLEALTAATARVLDRLAACRT